MLIHIKEKTRNAVTVSFNADSCPLGYSVKGVHILKTVGSILALTTLFLTLLWKKVAKLLANEPSGNGTPSNLRFDGMLFGHIFLASLTGWNSTSTTLLLTV